MAVGGGTTLPQPRRAYGRVMYIDICAELPDDNHTAVNLLKHLYRGHDTNNNGGAFTCVIPFDAQIRFTTPRFGSACCAGTRTALHIRLAHSSSFVLRIVQD